MKILALSDIHGDLNFIQEMANLGNKEKVDLVILAGDLVHENNKSVEGLIGPFKAKGLEVAVLPGNHEGLAEIGFLVDMYGVKNLHGYVIKKGNVGIFGCGYANVGPHFLDEKSIFSTLKKTHGLLGGVEKKIMVTHVHPSQSILGLNMFPGSPSVKKALEEFKPDIHICGHIHETQGIEEKVGNTRVINVGKSGKIIEIQ